jgi:hypothetical protein
MAGWLFSCRNWGAGLLWTSVALALFLWVSGPALADEMCQGSRPANPRNSDLDVLEIHIAPEGITGRIKNTSDDTAVGVMVWISYFRGARGGLFARGCIPIGDMAPGEERLFQGRPPAGAAQAESWTHAAEALEWR